MNLLHASITSWATWTSAGVSVRAAPIEGPAGKLGAWPEAPALTEIHPRARRPHPAAKVLTQLGAVVLGERRPPELGLLLGSASGSAGADREFDRELLARGQGFGSPSLFVYTLPTAPLGEVSIALQAKGPLMTVSAGTASGLSAVARAIEWVETGRCEQVLCGSLEHGVAHEEVALFLVEQADVRRVQGQSSFGGGAAVAFSAIDLARALASADERTLTASDSHGFTASVHVGAR